MESKFVEYQIKVMKLDFSSIYRIISCVYCCLFWARIHLPNLSTYIDHYIKQKAKNVKISIAINALFIVPKIQWLFFKAGIHALLVIVCHLNSLHLSF